VTVTNVPDGPVLGLKSLIDGGAADAPTVHAPIPCQSEFPALDCSPAYRIRLPPNGAVNVNVSVRVRVWLFNVTGLADACTVHWLLLIAPAVPTTMPPANGPPESPASSTRNNDPFGASGFGGFGFEYAT